MNLFCTHVLIWQAVNGASSASNPLPHLNKCRRDSFCKRNFILWAHLMVQYFPKPFIKNCSLFFYQPTFEHEKDLLVCDTEQPQHSHQCQPPQFQIYDDTLLWVPTLELQATPEHAILSAIPTVLFSSWNPLILSPQFCMVPAPNRRKADHVVTLRQHIWAGCSS